MMEDPTFFIQQSDYYRTLLVLNLNLKALLKEMKPRSQNLTNVDTFIFKFMYMMSNVYACLIICKADCKFTLINVMFSFFL